MSGKNIVIIATLDTKGEEAEYLKKLIEDKGHKAIVVDAGILGEPRFQGDISREKIAELGGRTLNDLIRDARSGVEKMKILKVVIEGVKKAVLDLYQKGMLHTIIATRAYNPITIPTTHTNP
ncbi:MAG: Tm-1-like ATP-binding domain-containing protein [Thermoproteales archaeon]|nr:Tm-1-like ATP-binding domain-containing protein [Thermoproteales archaeon]